MKSKIRKVSALVLVLVIITTVALPGVVHAHEEEENYWQVIYTISSKGPPICFYTIVEYWVAGLTGIMMYDIQSYPTYCPPNCDRH